MKNIIEKTNSKENILKLLKNNVQWTLLFISVLVFSLIFPNFFTSRNLINILRNSAMIGTVSVGMIFAMIAGTFDLSVGTTMGLATVIIIKMHPQTLLQSIVAILVVLAIGALIGLINGVVVGKWRESSIITTIGMQYVILGITLIYTQGKHVWADNFYPGLEFIGKGRLGNLPFPIIIFIIIGLLGQLILNNTRFGRHLYAVGGNVNASELSGINVYWTRIIAYMFSGISAAVAGVMIATRTQNVDPSFGFGQETDVLTGVLLGGVSLYGGKGSIIGTFAGVLFLYVVTNAMTLSGIPYQWQLIIKGTLFITAVAVSVNWEKRG
jgi:ribose transport system permease protein